MTDPVLRDYSKYPRMAHWFSPWLLFRLLNNVILSSLFGKYSDRRLMIAALDTVSPETHFKRATDLRSYFQPDSEGAVWIDWVADLGDGFDSTYAVASLLARKELAIGDDVLPRGQALFLGGDEVYPAASSQAYRNQLRQPYAWAFPDHDRKSDDGIPVFAIPGNHDWYDGLVLFLAFFCREKHWHLGNWRSQQRRSYFAVQITDKWWLWATDIQLADDMDQPQADYFTAIARQMPPDSKIILCSAEPGWLYTHTNSKSWGIMDYAIDIAEGVDRGLTIPFLLSGDTHHYSRYAAQDGTQFVTSGGGGAFLHPTHQLANKVTVKWSGRNKDLSQTTSPDAGHVETGKPACYPSKEISRHLLWRNLFFAITNWDFSLLMGVIYWIMAIGLTLRDQWDAYGIVALIFASAIMGYTYKQEKSARASVLITSAFHSAAHVFAVVFFSRFFAQWNEAHLTLVGQWYSIWKWLGILLVEMGLVGFFIGSTIFGLNLLITCACFRMNYNDAFSAFRLGRYNNFLRLRIKGNTLEIFAIGLQDVPKRHEWTANPKAARSNPDEPVFIPLTPLRPHLIEKVLV
jgi:Calcineurin-like phosphoesterase